MTNTVKFCLGMIPTFVLVCVVEASIPASVTALAVWMGMWELPALFLGILTFVGIGITSIFGAVAIAQEMGVSLSSKTEVELNNIIHLHKGERR